MKLKLSQDVLQAHPQNTGRQADGLLLQREMFGMGSVCVTPLPFLNTLLLRFLLLINLWFNSHLFVQNRPWFAILSWLSMWTQATMKPVKGPENVYLPPIRYAGSHGLRKALWLAGQVPDWPADELPQAFHGFHEDWGGWERLWRVSPRGGVFNVRGSQWCWDLRN